MAEPDRAQEFALRSGLGVALARVPLRGRLEVAGGEVGAELWLSPRGLWLIGARSSTDGVAVDLLAPGALRYEPGRTKDRLIVGARLFSTRPGRASQAREVIARGRLAMGAEQAWKGQSFPSQGSRLVRGLDRTVLSLLSRTLEPGEALVAWVPGQRVIERASALGARVSARSYFFLTERQQALIVLSALGDVERLELEPERITLAEGRLLLADQDGPAREVWSQSPTVAEPLFELLRRREKERVVEAAFVELRAGHLGWAERLLVAAREEMPLATLALEILALDHARPLEAQELGRALEQLRAIHAAPEVVADLWQRLKGSAEAGNVLLAKLRAHGALAEPWAAELHARIHRLKPKHAPPARLARHWLEVGRPKEALELLGRGLSAGDPKLDRALVEAPPRRALAELVELEELVLEAALAASSSDALSAAHALARLEPLSSRRIKALSELASGSLRARALEVLELIGPSGLRVAPDLPLPPAPPHPLDPALLDRRLPHPFGKKELGAGTLQAALAKSQAPDRETLRAWCERLSPERHPEAAAAASRARALLGLAQPELFVSRGERALGVRAFGGKVPCVVVGGAHLDPSSEYALGARELGFAIGTELGHVYYRHERATPREVWRGAVGKGRVALELVLAALPLAKGAQLGAKVSQVLDKVPTATLERALGLFMDLESNLKRLPGSNELTARHEELVAAHRAQQLTADRVGLVVARSIAPVVSGLFRLRGDHHALRDAIAEAGLEVAAQGTLLDHPELLLRIQALVSFYLSPEFDAFASA